MAKKKQKKKSSYFSRESWRKRLTKNYGWEQPKKPKTKIKKSIKKPKAIRKPQKPKAKQQTVVIKIYK